MLLGCEQSTWIHNKRLFSLEGLRGGAVSREALGMGGALKKGRGGTKRRAVGVLYHG